MTLTKVIKDVEVPYAYNSWGLGNNKKETYTLATYSVEKLDNAEVLDYLSRSYASSKRAGQSLRLKQSPRSSNTASITE